MDNMEGNILELLRLTSRLAEKVDGLDSRMNKLECIIVNDVRQDQRLESVEETAMGCSSRFIRIEERINSLEDMEGNKAKGLLSSVGKQLLTAAISFIIACVGFYIVNK